MQTQVVNSEDKKTHTQKTQKACIDYQSAMKDHLSLHCPSRLILKHGRQTQGGLAC